VWYRLIRKSQLNPPDAVFGPVWTVLYGLSTVAVIRLYLAKPSRARGACLKLWALQQTLNAAWSPLFFGKQRARAALLDLGLLWLTLGSLIRKASEVDRVAARLLYPYFAWVTFAGYLNYAVVRKNPSWLT
jgi:tryptophan-rich sensory protein